MSETMLQAAVSSGSSLVREVGLEAVDCTEIGLDVDMAVLVVVVSSGGEMWAGKEDVLPLGTAVRLKLFAMSMHCFCR